MPAFTNIIECKDCGATFQNWSGLYRHQRVFHSDGQPEYHVCDCCGKIFLRRDNLKRHMKTHTTQETNEQFMCEKCDMVFSRKSNLRRHEQSVHPTNSFICEICEKEFSRKDNYVRHKKIHEKDAPHTDQPVHEKSSSPDVTSAFDGHAEDQLPTMDDIYQQHKKLIRTHSRMSNKVRHLFNYELLSSDPGEIRQYAEEVFERQKTAFKVNVAFGFILRNNETQVLRYHYASTNGRLFDAPRQILDRNSFDAFVKELEMADYLEYARQQRPNSKWVVDRITNISFYVYPLREYPIGCQSDQDLPDFIVRNKSILNHPYMNLSNDNSNLCFFRCLAAHLHGKKRRVEKLSLKYFRKYTTESPKSFRGVKLSELDGLEKLFNVNIVVYELIKEESADDGEKEKVVAQLVRRSINKFASTMYLNIYRNHFSYIADINRYCKRYECRKCKKLWKTAGRLNRHESKCEGSGVRKVYPGGVYVTPPTVFEDLESEGIHVPNHDRYFPYFAVYDYESVLQGLTGTSRTEKMEMINEHIPVSVSIASNVPGYESPQCFISDGNATNLVSTMVTYLHEISYTSRAILEDRYTPVFQEIETRISNMKKMASSTAQEENAIPKVTFLTKLKYRLKAFAKELPVVGFNSGKYDINIVKRFLYPVLLSSDPISFIVKRNNNHMAIKTEHLNFLDILNYLAPGFSYNLFIKAYKCLQTKGFFPYEWLDSLEKLDHPRLPPHEAFFSKLKMENISDEDYSYCQRVWEENRMMTMRDFLTWYNNRDVQPFVEAVEKMTDFYRERGIDMFKDGISVPGLTLKYLMKTVPMSTNFSLVHERDADLFQTMKKNLIGGPSIVFTRYHEKNETRIRGGKLCRKIVGYDANALYLWAIMQEMPTGHYVRRKSEKQFRPQTKLPMAAEWLEYESYRNGVAIRHAGNNTEKRIGPRNVPVDGFCSQTNTVFQFHGCWWHGHDCQLNEGKKFNEKRKRSMADLYQETRDNSDYIKQCGYNLVEMWECDYRKKRMTDEILKEFLNRYQRPLHKTWKMTEKEILQAVMEDKLFGMVECDIHVPDDLKDTFSEMCPIFKNATITRDDIGNFMKSFAERNGIMKAPRRNLIGSMFGHQVMIITPLLKWYIQHGLVVSKIHQVVEYTPQRCFLHFGQAVSDARRAGDLDKDKAIIADTMKLIGNSSYGKTITNKDKHRLIKICDFVDAAKYVRDINFREIDPVTEDCYEVEMSKKTIKEDLPIQIGLFVYQYAKMRMLEFYYDFLLKYVDRADFEMCEMDTDSAYIAISSDTLEEVIKPDRREAYHQDMFNWFPRDDTPANARYDKRTPGLFKVEWEGDGIVALCSKTYYCFGSKDKFSCKGINKKQNDITKSLYLDVLTSGESASRKNTGFIVKKNTVFTYNQIREGFTNFYPKRKVLDDGVSTTYLDI